MAPDSTTTPLPESAPPPDQESDVPAAPGPAPGAKGRIRLRFRKDGALRWLSHHDLLRTFERILRRSGLPFRNTQGFHPHPRIIFGLSLPLGVVGRAEVVDVELDEEIDPAEVRDRLAAQCPAGLSIFDAKRIKANAGVHVRGLCYGIEVPASRRQATQQRITEVLAGGPCWVERDKPERRRLDIHPFLRGLLLDPETGFFQMNLWLLPSGTARPDEVLTVLGLADLLEAGAVLERTFLEMEEDSSPPPAAGQE